LVGIAEVERGIRKERGLTGIELIESLGVGYESQSDKVGIIVCVYLIFGSFYG